MELLSLSLLFLTHRLNNSILFSIWKLCTIDGDVIGYFAGIVCDYTDFYYRIVLEDEPRSILHSCVGKIDFID